MNEEEYKEQFTYDGVETNTLPIRKIVIVGGGFAGLSCCKKLKMSNFVELVFIDKLSYHIYKPFLNYVVTNNIDINNICIPFRNILHNKAKILNDTLIKVYLDKKCIETKDYGVIEYDYLVLANGAVKNKKENYRTLNNIEDAMDIRNELIRNWERAENEYDEQKRKMWLSATIIGGGEKGVELAVAIRELANKTINYKYKRIKKDDVHIILIEETDRLLKKYSEDVSEYADMKLRKMEIELRYKKRFISLKDDCVTLDQGMPIWSKTVINCTKELGGDIELIGDKELNKTKMLNLEQYTEVFTIKDFVVNKGDYDIEDSIRAGKIIANNINRMLNKKELKSYSKKTSKGIINMGKGLCVTQLGYLPVKSFWSIFFYLVKIWRTDLSRNKFKKMIAYLMSFLPKNKGPFIQ